MTASIEIEKQAHDVYRLTLARPEVHNAFDDTVINALSEALKEIALASPRVLVLQAIGARQARRYFASAERFDAQTAQRIGLVHEVVAVDSLPATTDELITQLLQSSPDAQKKARDLIDEIAPRSSNIDDKLLDDTANAIADARASAEGREGISAFLEKRKPSWVPS